jgi:hypothetical protein
MTLFLDIETIPGQSPEIEAALRAETEEEKSALHAPANYKDPAKIDEYLASRRAEIDAGFDERFHRFGLSGATGMVFCVGAALDDEPVKIFCHLPACRESEDSQRFRESLIEGERRTLAAFAEWLCQVENGHLTVVGHIVAAFDLRFLRQRSIVTGIRLPELLPHSNARPWDSHLVWDTMIQWAGIGNRISLDALCQALGLHGKNLDDFPATGADVWEAVKCGGHGVSSYCDDDVELVRSVYRRMTFQTMKEAA